AVLRLPQLIRPRPEQRAQSIDAKLMAERSLKAGYMKDALKYLQVAHETDPGDFDVMRKLGWTYNLLHQDDLARRWFALARKSPDAAIASESDRAWKNLHASVERFRTTAWLYPMFSTRWHDVFGYAQIKEEFRLGRRLVPYASVRFVGDTRVNVGPFSLSES